MQIPLETVNEETDEHIRENKKCTNIINQNNCELREQNLNANIIDRGFVLSPLYLTKKHRIKNCSHVDVDDNNAAAGADVTYKGHTIFATPIMLLNNIRESFDGSDNIERKTVCEQVSFPNSGRSSHVTKRGSIESNSFSGKHIWYGVSLATLIIMTTIIATMMVTWHPSPNISQAEKHRIDEPSSFHLNASWFISRNQWGARQPILRKYLPLPVAVVIIGGTNTKYVKTKEQCRIEMQKLQSTDMKKRFYHDIAYNFVICGWKNLIFEGRGANVCGAHTSIFNDNSIMIAVIGKFNKTTHASAKVLQRVDLLINTLINHGKVSDSYILLGKSYVAPDLNTPFQKTVDVMKNFTHIRLRYSGDE